MNWLVKLICIFISLGVIAALGFIGSVVENLSEKKEEKAQYRFWGGIIGGVFGIVVVGIAWYLYVYSDTQIRSSRQNLSSDIIYPASRSRTILGEDWKDVKQGMEALRTPTNPRLGNIGK